MSIWSFTNDGKNSFLVKERQIGDHFIGARAILPVKFANDEDELLVRRVIDAVNSLEEFGAYEKPEDVETGL